MLSDIKGNQIAALLIPTAVTLITARDEAGDDCVATVAWVMPISHEPSLIAVAIRPNGRTSTAMETSGAFVVNVLAPGSEQIAITCGKKSGIDDRVAQAGLQMEPAQQVEASRVAQAASWVECELLEHRPYGDHELYIGRTLCAQTKGATTEDGTLAPAPVMLMGQRGCFGHFEED